MKSFLLTAVVLAGAACGGAPQTSPPETKAEIAKSKPLDESRRFPKENQTAMELVDDHMLGNEDLPGGNLATYQKDGKAYQLFLIVMPDAQTASLEMFDLKEKLTGATFVPSFGGYFGLDGDQPWFVFAKDKQLAGVVGLPQNEADLVAREFASRIPAN